MSVDRGGGGDDAGAKTGVEHSPFLFLAASSLTTYQPPALRGTLYSVVPCTHLGLISLPCDAKPFA